MISLRPDQNNAATHLYEHDRVIVLGDVGSGKTATVLQAMYEMVRDGHVRRWLVIAPKRVCTQVWPKELEKWNVPLTMSVAVATPDKPSMPKAEREAAFRRDAQVYVINFDTLQQLPEDFWFDGVVIDELTKFKNGSATTRSNRKQVSKGKRFAAIYNRLESVNIRWGMTGSFTSNGLKDVFGQCKIIDQSYLGRSKGAFLQKYFIPECPERDQWIPRPGSMQAVMQTIRPLVVFLDNEEYRNSLPPLRIVPMKLSMDRMNYEHMLKNAVLSLQGKNITAVNAGVVSQKLQQLASGFIYHTEKEAAEVPGLFKTTKTPVWLSDHKLEAIDEILEESQGANIIVAYWFKEELEQLQKRYPYAETLDAKNAEERWNRGGIRMLLVHPASAGHGLNLQFGGHHLIFTSLPWSLELFEQTIGRLIRTGQLHAVYVYLLLAERTIDERIWFDLQNKRDYSSVAFAELLGK